MSDDEDDMQMEYAFDGTTNGHDLMGFGPLLPTEAERSLMDRVRQELKVELKQVRSFNPSFDPLKASFSTSYAVT